MQPTLDTLKERVLTFLSEKAELQGVKTPRGTVVQLDFTQGDIATLLGMDRADATRAINALKRDGSIDIEGASIIIRD